MNYDGTQTTNCFVTCDGNGNMAALINAMNGLVCARYEYGPFGELIRATGPMAKLNPFRFSTKYQDDETDLVYYGYRYYNASTGRWLSRDPMEEECGVNLYVFADNTPVDTVDFLGLESIGDWVKNRARTQGASFTGDFLPPVPLGPGTLNFNYTGAVEKRECCNGCAVYEYLQFSGTIEIYYMVGKSFKKRMPPNSYPGPVIPGRKTTLGKPGRNDRLPDPDNPGGTKKRKNHPGFPQAPESGYRERFGYGENGPMQSCPKNEELEVDGYLFARGSVGFGVGGQVNVSQNIDANFDILHGWNVTGGLAFGTFGASIEAGGGVTFYYPFDMKKTDRQCRP